MIGYLKGTIKDFSEGIAILLNNDIGWEVKVGSIPLLIEQDVEFYIHTQSTENDLQLWGFLEAKQLKLFKYLLKVSGIGGKTAQLLITEKGVDNVVRNIIDENPDGLKVAGVGKKTAEKVIVYLKGKIKDDFEYNTSTGSMIRSTERSELTEALTALGYTDNQISRVIDNLSNLDKLDKNLGLQDLVRESLKLI